MQRKILETADEIENTIARKRENYQRHLRDCRRICDDMSMSLDGIEGNLEMLGQGERMLVSISFEYELPQVC